MPELPDVEAMRGYLEGEGLAGRVIIGAKLNWPRAVRGTSLEDLVLGILKRRILSVRRRAKLLILPLVGNRSLHFHMRMTGSLLLEPASQPRHVMTRNLLELDDGRELRFVDPRKLGTVQLVHGSAAVLERLGPEPLDPSFTPAVFADRLQGRRVPIKALLCDQAVVAGIGNIYADEILFAASVNPLTTGSGLSGGQVEAIHRATVEILNAAIGRLAKIIDRGGPPTESAEGLASLLVPRKAGLPCARCESLVERVVVRGRSAYYCPACQA